MDSETCDELFEACDGLFEACDGLFVLNEDGQLGFTCRRMRVCSHHVLNHLTFSDRFLSAETQTLDHKSELLLFQNLREELRQCKQGQ